MLLLLALLAASPDVPTATCATARMLREAPPPRDFGVGVLGTPVARDALAVPNALVSEHFALRWGNGGGLDQATLTAALERLEQVWSVEVDQLQNPKPPGSDAFLFNVYVGDTGDNAPPLASVGAAAYLSYDADGVLMMVLGIDGMRDLDGLGSYTMAHELYHAIQQATTNYFNDEAAWYGEASAEWMAGEVFPDNPYVGINLFGLAFFPHVPLDSFSQQGTLEDYHRYGAFIFLRYVSEHGGLGEVVLDTYRTPNIVGDPLEVIGTALVGHGAQLADVVGEFAAHTAVLDYQQHDQFALILESIAAAYPNDDHRLAATVDVAAATDDAIDVAPEDGPGRYGFHTVRLDTAAVAAPGLALEVSVDARAAGSLGSATAVRATVVQVQGSTPSYRPVPLANGQGAVRFNDVSSDSELFLVVAAVPESAAPGETFPYRYRVRHLAIDAPRGPDDDDGDDRDPDADEREREVVVPLGCGGSPGQTLAWSLLALATLTQRPRRRPAPGAPRGVSPRSWPVPTA